MNKAVYGTIQGAIRFYEELTDFLKSRGYKVNPYDPCVFNRTITGKQMTILFHVDDLKLSHVDPNVVTEEIQKLQLEFGKLAELTISRGRVHEYLGMTLDFTTPKKCKVIMTDYVDEILGSAPEELFLGRGQARTPAANDLFKISDTEKQLPKHRSDTFHSLTAQLLFLCKRSRPDLQVAIAFLCTRVQEPTEEDWKKLGRVLKYLMNTKDMFLTMEANDIKQFKWWVDSSFNTHWDSKGHSGRSGTLGKGAIISSSQKQKVNAGSSTESELIGDSDALSDVVWSRYFLLEQGYNVEPSILYQDNESTIKLLNNGRRSSKRTKHINNRFFAVHGKIKEGEIEVDYCPTATMWADGLTKPLQGKMFEDFRNHLMNPGDSADEGVCCGNPNTRTDERRECMDDEQPSGRG